MGDIIDTVFQVLERLVVIIIPVITVWILVSQHNLRKQQLNLEKQQYEVEKLRWRLALYDRRYAVYNSTMKFIARTLTPDFSDQDLLTFLRNAKDNEFLFGNEIKEFVDQLYKNGCTLAMNCEILKGNVDTNEKDKHVKSKFELMGWFGKQYDVSKSKFGEYLKVDK